METFLIKAAQLILAFAILVIIHEFGHFLFARIFGVKVEKFYIFFNPWTSLFKWKPKRYYGFFNKKKKLKSCPPDAEKIDSDPDRKTGLWNDTEYGVGWLPLGGYCKIAGMIDESMDTEQMKQPPKDWEFRSKPAWQRLLIMIAGVLFNFLLAIIIYAGIVFATGEKYVPMHEAKDGFIYSPAAQVIGFRDGDVPLYADGDILEEPGAARMKMLQASSVEVLRGKDTVDIKIPEDFIFRINDEMEQKSTPINFLTYRLPTRVIQVTPGEGAAKAGIEPGDEIIAIDGEEVPSLDVFFEKMKGKENKKLDFTIVRKEGDKTDTLNKMVAMNANSKAGIGLEIDPSAFYHADVKTYNLFQAVPKGISMGVERLSSYASSMKLVFTSEGAKSIGGFGAIGSIFPEKWDWIAFWNIAAFLSVALAFMNILPIPALDGGHVLFLLYEVITGKQPSEKFMEWAQMIGMGLLILLLVYANGMDIVRLFK